jgi:hypothetical protein
MFLIFFSLHPQTLWLRSNNCIAGDGTGPRSLVIAVTYTSFSVKAWEFFDAKKLASNRVVESLPSWLPPAKTGFTLLGVRGGVVC